MASSFTFIFLCFVATAKHAATNHGAETHKTVLVYNITCAPSSGWDCKNETLETIAAGIDEKMDIQINIKIHDIQLRTNLSFSNLNSLTINGKSDFTNIICIAENAGILLSDIAETVTLRNINLTLCGFGSRLTHSNNTYSSALTIIRCKRVDINRLIIEWSKGIGLMIIAQQGSTVNISSAFFKGNQLSQHNYNFTTRIWGGGGVYITMNKCLNTSTKSSTSVIQFQDCTFENNTSNITQYEYSYTNILGEVNEGYGRGGGVYALFNSSLTNTNLSFFRCKFIANNAFRGGGLSVKVYGNETKNINITIIDSIFARNGCSSKYKAGFGGGAHLALYTALYNSGITDSHYFLNNVTFTANCAELGGGLCHFSTRQDIQNSNSMTLNDCIFEENKAHMGSAVMMAPDVDRTPSTGYSMTFRFVNCQFFSNTACFSSSAQSQITAGIGTVYISSYDIHFQGHSSNSGSALYIVNAIINFQESNANFINNSGPVGGAIALIGSSKIILGRKTYTFVHNVASLKGGAIYVSLTDSLDFIISKDCFIQYIEDQDKSDAVLSNDWKANITFIGNRAKDPTAGHAVYATSLHSCLLIYRPNNYYTLLNASEVFSARGFKFNNNETAQIATDGAILQSTKSQPLTMIPGERINHGVLVTDDLGQQTNGSFWATVTEKSNGTRLDSTAYSTLITDKIKIKGKPSQRFDLDLNTLSPRQSFITLYAELLDCPPGFALKNNSECVCNLDGYIGLHKCDNENFQSYLHPGYWAGYIHVDQSIILITSTCPFCDYSYGATNVHNILPRNHSELDRVVCGDSRTGTVCGKCRENFTTHFHSPGFLCKSMLFGCRLGWLFYILSELVPVTMVFIIVLVFDISFTSGAINGFILYSQILSSIDLTASGIIEIPGTTIKYATQVYQIFYGFFNLNFFNSESLSFCLWKGASTLDMLAIKYITILYTTLLIVTVILVMNKCGGRWMGKYCRITAIKTSVIHGISSFLMISYAQCVNVSLRLLYPLHIYASLNSNYELTPRVWFNGEIVHFSKQHLPYAIPALFCLFTTGLFPPALLLTYPLLNKGIRFLGIEDNRFVRFISDLFKPINTLKPLLDSFQGCFKDNFRFFAGLYFLYRWTIPIIYMNPVFSIYYIAIGCTLLIILTLHTIVQPYIKRAHNVIDTLLLSNLILINFFSLFSYHKSHNQKQIGSIVASAVVQLVLIYLPLIVLCVYLLALACRQALMRANKINGENFCQLSMLWVKILILMQISSLTIDSWIKIWSAGAHIMKRQSLNITTHHLLYILTSNHIYYNC